MLMSARVLANCNVDAGPKRWCQVCRQTLWVYKYVLASVASCLFLVCSLVRLLRCFVPYQLDSSSICSQVHRSARFLTGFMSPTSPDPSPKHIDPADDEVACILSELSLIEGLTHKPAWYAYLCRRLNSIQSHVSSLPPELLSIIFQHASPSLSYFARDHEEGRLFHLALRLVSGHWYNIVQSTPELWNCVYSKQARARKDFEKYLQLCLDNSANLPFTIHLGNFGESTAMPESIPSGVLESMILSNAHRIHDLRLFRPPITWLTLLLPKLSRLSALDVRWRQSDFLGSNLSQGLQISSINLRRLAIHAPIRTLCVDSPRSSITHLIFHHTPIDVCFDLFMECQNVIEFHCVSPAYPTRNVISLINRHPLVYQHLISFTWHLLDSSESAYWTALLLNHVRVPALKSLTWLNISCFHRFLDALCFFQRLPISLHEITFDGMYMEVDVSMPIWLDYIRHDAELLSIRVQHCTESFLNKVFSKLFKKVTSSNALVVPFLKLNQYHSAMRRDDGRNQRMSSKIGESLVQLLEERRGLIDQFTFWTTGYDLCWSKEIWLNLKAVQDCSFRLVIGEHGRCVDVLAKCNML